VAALAIWISQPLPSFAAQAPAQRAPALYMAADALVARPLLLAMTMVGAVVYVGSLPFSLIGGNAGQAAEVLVAGPARMTFARCLGCTHN